MKCVSRKSNIHDKTKRKIATKSEYNVIPILQTNHTNPKVFTLPFYVHANASTNLARTIPYRKGEATYE